jgi:hypothetical protein
MFSLTFQKVLCALLVAGWVVLFTTSVVALGRVYLIW